MIYVFVHVVVALYLGALRLVPSLRLNSTRLETSTTNAAGKSFSDCVTRLYEDGHRMDNGSQLNDTAYRTLSELYARHETENSPYSPYITSMPVYYIKMDGNHDVCSVAFRTFSPFLFEIGATDPSKLMSLAAVSEGSVDALNQGVYSSTDLAHVLSHMVAIRKAYISGDHVAMVVEDSALPMFPVWDRTLEEYALELPDGWEVSQLERSVTEPEFQFEQLGDRTFEEGPALGTAAYLIHRRGMERVMSEFWNASIGKFNLNSFRSSCKAMSVGSCLLGFTASTQNTDQNIQPSSLNLYRSTWPLFTRGPEDLSTQLRFGTDIDFISKIATHNRHNVPSALMQSEGVRTDAESVLFFFAVGSNPQGYKMLQSNVELLRKGGLTNPHIFLAFYSGNSSSHQAELKGLELEDSMSDSGFKMKLLNRSHQLFGPTWRRKYEYIYAVDEDFSMAGFQMDTFMFMARKSGSVLVGSTYLDTSTRGGDYIRQFQGPHSDCWFRYVNFVEVGAFLLHRRAWDPIFNQCKHCVHDYSMWGLDQMWCYFLAKSLGGYPTNTSAMLSERRSACAMVDSTRLVHADYRTLGGIGNESDFEAKRDVRRHHGPLVEGRRAVDVCIRRDADKI